MSTLYLEPLACYPMKRAIFVKIGQKSVKNAFWRDVAVFDKISPNCRIFDPGDSFSSFLQKLQLLVLANSPKSNRLAPRRAQSQKTSKKSKKRQNSNPCISGCSGWIFKNKVSFCFKFIEYHFWFYDGPCISHLKKIRKRQSPFLAKLQTVTLRKRPWSQNGLIIFQNGYTFLFPMLGDKNDVKIFFLWKFFFMAKKRAKIYFFGHFLAVAGTKKLFTTKKITKTRRIFWHLSQVSSLKTQFPTFGFMSRTLLRARAHVLDFCAFFFYGNRITLCPVIYSP